MKTKKAICIISGLLCLVLIILMGLMLFDVVDIDESWFIYMRVGSVVLAAVYAMALVQWKRKAR